jgi:hypothetical protein
MQPETALVALSADTPAHGERIASAPMARAWRCAAEDLGVRLISPHSVQHQGRCYWSSALLPDFGSAAGTVVADRHCGDAVLKICAHAGYFAPRLSRFYFEDYNREYFVIALNAWGWYGPECDVPTWFRGVLHKHGGQ